MTNEEQDYLQEVEERKELGLTILVVIGLAAFFIGIIGLINIFAP